MSLRLINVGGVNGGFNNKNRRERISPIHHDTARKFFKDTDPKELRDWHNKDVQQFISRNRGFDKHGIFLLDQTHVVVPENENYKIDGLVKSRKSFENVIPAKAGIQ
jgi:hypothetical protein